MEIKLRGILANAFLYARVRVRENDSTGDMVGRQTARDILHRRGLCGIIGLEPVQRPMRNTDELTPAQIRDVTTDRGLDHFQRHTLMLDTTLRAADFRTSPVEMVEDAIAVPGGLKYLASAFEPQELRRIVSGLLPEDRVKAIVELGKDNFLGLCDLLETSEQLYFCLESFFEFASRKIDILAEIFAGLSPEASAKDF